MNVGVVKDGCLEAGALLLPVLIHPTHIANKPLEHATEALVKCCLRVSAIPILRWPTIDPVVHKCRGSDSGGVNIVRQM
jgi:hypothetical protein